jgi:hypothetical protein
MSTFAQTDVACNGVVLGSGITPTIASSNALARLGLTARGELRVAQALAPTAELARAGSYFRFTSDAVASAKHALVTTTDQHAFTNNYPVGGKHMVLEMIAATCTVTIDSASPTQIIFQNSPEALTATQYGTVDTLTAVQDLFNGRNMLTYGNAIFGHAGTLAADTGWAPLHPLAIPVGTLTASVGAGIVVRLGGELVIAPQRTCHFAVVEIGAATTGTWNLTYYWHEVQLS